MTTATLEERTALPPARTDSAPRRFGLVRHSLAMAKRTLLTMRRTPEQFFDVTIQPIIFLIIFVYLFGGAVSGSTAAYLPYVLPGIMVQSVLFSSMTIGVNLNTDISKGVFDRFRSLPIARSAPLIGAVLADVVRYVISIVVLLVAGTIMGFRIHTDVLQAFLACLLVIVFALSICWAAVVVGMLVREPGGVQGLTFALMFPLTFGSNLFVQTNTLPGWLQAWVKINPVTHLVNAVRGLTQGGAVFAPTAWTLAWSAGLLLVLFPLAVRGYRRRA